MTAKLGLGTVQFGLDYGISNHSGQTPFEEVVKILTVAQNQNINFLDTAALYGNSEETLGKAILPEDSFSIVTKTPRFEGLVIGGAEVQLLQKVFHRSLERLKHSSVYGLLMHDSDDLFKGNGSLLYHQLEDLKKEGLVKKIGVSVYTGEQIDRLIDNFPVDLIQLPINVFDQRLIQDGYLKKLKKLNIEIHARSIFLQGLLLMDPEKLSPYFTGIKQHLLDYHSFIHDQGYTAIESAVGFILGLQEIDTVIIGVNNSQQLSEICLRAKPLSPENFCNFALTNEKILNPSNWRL